MANSDEDEKRDEVEVQSDARLMALVDKLNSFEQLSGNLPTNERPLFIVSLLATATGAGIFLADRAIEAISVNMGNIITAIFGFYALTALQSLVATVLRWWSSEREIRQIYEMRLMIVKAFIQNKQGLTDVELQTVMELVAKDRDQDAARKNGQVKTQ